MWPWVKVTDLGSWPRKGHPVHFPRPMYTLSQICKVWHKTILTWQAKVFATADMADAAETNWKHNSHPRPGWPNESISFSGTEWWWRCNIEQQKWRSGGKHLLYLRKWDHFHMNTSDNDAWVVKKNWCRRYKWVQFLLTHWALTLRDANVILISNLQIDDHLLWNCL